jgi:hypothetical protein
LPVPLKLVQARGTLIFGDGPTKTVLRALDATLDSIINLENCAICSVRDLSVEGPTPGTLVQNGIYIHRNGASPGLTPTNIKLSNLRVGRDDGASLNDGILFTYDQFATATSLQDPSVSNNDEHLIEDCEIVNCLSNGVDLFGPNILGVKILGGSISSSAPNSIGIGATGGSFTVFGTTIGVQQMMFRMNYGFAGNPNADSGGPNVWFQQYPVTIHSVLAETPATILWTSPDSGGYDVYVHFVGCSFKNGPRPGDPNVVAFNSQGKLTFTGCFMVPNMAGSTANFVAAHAQSDVLLSGCYLSFSSVNCAGRLTSVSNTWNTPVSFGASHVTAIGDVTSAAAARPLIFDTDAIGGSAGTAGSGVIYRNGQNQLFVS